MTKEEGKLKILGVNQINHGSKYHRVLLPLEAINGKTVKIGEKECVIEVSFTEFSKDLRLKEDHFKNYDVIYNHWLVPNDAIELSLWKNVYNTKFINDYDDTWDDKTHPYFSPTWEYGATRLAVLADFNTVATKGLANKLEPYTDNIAIIPNLLPVGIGQFVGKPVEKGFKEGKLRIGFLGSFSHIPDLLNFKNVVNKLAKNKKIVENCQFTLVCDDSKEWGLVKSMFEKKKNLNFKTIPFKSVTEYMSLYDEFDVVIQPLVENEHNELKSGLKVIESSIKDCIFLGSKLYERKEYPSYFKCELPIDYEKTLEFLLEEGNYVKYRDKVCAENIAISKWENRVDFSTKLIETCYNQIEQTLEDVKIYSITYNDDQKTEYIRYDNSGIKTIEQNSYLFEYNVIKDLIPKVEDEDYIGIFSYKFGNKTRLYKNLLNRLLVINNYKDYDIIGLSLKLFKGNYLEVSEEKHKGFTELFGLICKDLNLIVKEPKNVIYSNQFLAKGKVYKQFLNEVINPTIELLETKYKDLAWKDAGYIWGLKGEQLKEQTGLDYYPFHVFILERLLSVWLENKNMFSSNPVGSIKFMQLI